MIYESLLKYREEIEKAIDVFSVVSKLKEEQVDLTEANERLTKWKEQLEKIVSEYTTKKTELEQLFQVREEEFNQKLEQRSNDKILAATEAAKEIMDKTNEKKSELQRVIDALETDVKIKQVQLKRIEEKEQEVQNKLSSAQEQIQNLFKEVA